MWIIRFLKSSFFLGLVAAAAWVGTLTAQEKAVRVNLGGNTITVTPEGKNMSSLVLMLSADPEMKITAVSSNIRFPSRHVFFVKGSAKVEGDKCEARVEPDAEDEYRSRLMVTLSAAPGRRLSSGVIAELEFKISASTPDGLLEFPVSSRVHLDDASSELENVAGDPGLIAVSSTSPVIIACFFYMH
ncbi:hypothetical protein MYX82_00590 [Acidobacteria bacterium AH-259-D05]|nr:hypothetical protein [Acidobacteria bacterium AH-259-D05]